MQSLVVRLPNHLGDACMALPALECLAAAGWSLTIAGRPWAVDLLAARPWQVVALPPSRSDSIAALRGALKALPRETEALLLTNSFSSALEFRLAGLRPSGYATDGRRLLLRHAVPVPREWAGDMHTVAYYLHLARALKLRHNLPPGTRRPASVPAPQLPVSATARERASAALAAAGVHGPYVVLCPTARGQHHGQDKCWDGFGRLAGELIAGGHAVVVCPGPGEAEAARTAVPQVRPLEPLPLDAFAALLAASRLVVANDSGPGHLAAAVGAPLVGVFGVTDPTKTRPLGASVHIIGSSSAWPAYAQVSAQVAALLAPAPDPA
jgi:heptosyltransferase-2